MSKPKSAAAADPDAVLAERLDECREGVRTCFEIAHDRTYGSETRREAMNVAARLVKTSLAVAAALKKTPDFTHRIVVERSPPEGPTPTPRISGKTIPGVAPRPESQD
ncbi:MAG TPA: hypothetical protein VHT51_15935 [Micropepsaceae bacterium]|jgi:hypothetical protein|nr:hypothetical protein [Micropepsaceae bacterium]